MEVLFRPLPPLPSPTSLGLPSFLSLEDSSRRLHGPNWIPAFHHRNSPYVPWSSPVRRRILAPARPPSRLARSWKSFKHSLKSVLGHLLCTPCAGQAVLDDVYATQPTPPGSLASLVSSDSKTLAAWLAERRAAVSRDDMPPELSVDQYERVGSWLDRRHRREGGWLCGVQDCDMHTVGGSPSVGECRSGLRMAMPFDSTNLTPPSIKPSPVRFYSLPQLPRMLPARIVEPTMHAERCGEPSMPGGWTFN